MAARTDDAYAFYNNHYGAKAVVNALQLQMLLGAPRPAEPLPEPLQQKFPELLGTLSA